MALLSLLEATETAALPKICEARSKEQDSSECLGLMIPKETIVRQGQENDCSRDYGYNSQKYG